MKLKTRKQTEAALSAFFYWRGGLLGYMWALRNGLTDDEWAQIREYSTQLWELKTKIEEIFVKRLGQFEVERVRRNAK